MAFFYGFLEVANLIIKSSFIIFFLVPAILGFYYSLTDYKGFATPEFVGLANYVELFQDESFYKALFRTFRYMIILVPFIYIVSLSIALLVTSKKAKGTFIARIIFFLPWTISGIIAGVIWRWLFGENFGFINYMIDLMGGEPVMWFSNPNTAFSVIILGLCHKSTYTSKIKTDTNIVSTAFVSVLYYN